MKMKIPLSVHLRYIMIIEFIFRGFLKIMSFYRFWWAQDPTVNYLTLNLEAPLNHERESKYNN
jgi:hypothetical protein